MLADTLLVSRVVSGFRRCAVPALSVGALLLAGCGQFFPPINSTSGSGSGSGSGGSTATGNNLYVLNSGLGSVAALSLSSGTVTALSDSPYALNTSVNSMAINPAGTLLYVGSILTGLYVFTINNGALTLGGGNTVVSTSGGDALAVDPSGQWLLAVTDAAGTAPVLSTYGINGTTGALSNGTTIGLDTGTATQIVFAPNGTEAFIPLSTGGIDAVSFAPGTGVVTKLSVLVQPLGNGYADQALAINPAGTLLFAAETGTNGVRVFSIGSDGGLTEVSGSPYATALGPHSVLVDSTGTYVYVANTTAGTVSAFSIGSTGALTPLSGSPFDAGSGPVSLAEDSTDSYLEVACSGGSPDLEIFSIGSATAAVPGGLTSASTASTSSGSSAVATQVVATP
jgi:6-phosphogluconolactonase (cycloisomerase 2 family)